MKYCTNCRWLRDVNISGSPNYWQYAAKCVYRIKTERHIIDGHEFYTQDPMEPWVERHNAKGCGLDAKNYKRSWWRLWAQK